MAGVSLEMIQTTLLRVIEEQRSLREEGNQMRSLVLALVDSNKRLERRVSEVKDDIELMLKAEIMGRLGNYETTIDARLEAVEARLRPPSIS